MKDLPKNKQDAWAMVVSGPESELKDLEIVIRKMFASVYHKGANMKVRSTNEKTLEYLASEVARRGLEEISFELVSVASSWEKVFCGRA